MVVAQQLSCYLGALLANLSVGKAITVGQFASACLTHAGESPLVAELKAGSEEAYAWLVDHYHGQVYNLVSRIIDDRADAADTTQEVFLKVFRGIKRFHGTSSLRTWIYRIAVHEASNQRRWWRRHKGRETSIEPAEIADTELSSRSISENLADVGATPYDSVRQQELLARVEDELRHLPEPYRTTLVLRDLEDLSYEEIADVTETSLGTVKSRLARGREILKQRLEPYLRQASGTRPNDAGRKMKVAL
jgi:RNA polymerase sigma-70 factor (ECF subfamily)